MAQSVEEGKRLCTGCKDSKEKGREAQVLKPFVCKGCEEGKTAATPGDWQLCDKCAADESRCTLCGKDL